MRKLAPEEATGAPEQPGRDWRRAYAPTRASSVRPRTRDSSALTIHQLRAQTRTLRDRAEAPHRGSLAGPSYDPKLKPLHSYTQQMELDEVRLEVAEKLHKTLALVITDSAGSKFTLEIEQKNAELPHLNLAYRHHDGSKRKDVSTDYAEVQQREAVEATLDYLYRYAMPPLPKGQFTRVAAFAAVTEQILLERGLASRPVYEAPDDASPLEQLAYNGDFHTRGQFDFGSASLEDVSVLLAGYPGRSPTDSITLEMEFKDGRERVCKISWPLLIKDRGFRGREIQNQSVLIPVEFMYQNLEHKIAFGPLKKLVRIEEFAALETLFERSKPEEFQAEKAILQAYLQNDIPAFREAVRTAHTEKD